MYFYKQIIAFPLTQFLPQFIIYKFLLEHHQQLKKNFKRLAILEFLQYHGCSFYTAVLQVSVYI